MRRLWLVAIAITFSVAHAQGHYFPKSSLDTRGDDFKSKWYSAQLRALGEPSLLALIKTPASESYRFLWLRSFHHPIAIRLVPSPDGTSMLTTKVGGGAGGYPPGTTIENSSRTLSKEQTQAFLSLVSKLKFWNAPNPIDDQKGTDGSDWIIEGVKEGRYHVVDRWSPNNGVARELGQMLAFDLAKLEIPKNEIY